MRKYNFNWTKTGRDFNRDFSMNKTSHKVKLHESDLQLGRQRLNKYENLLNVLTIGT